MHEAMEIKNMPFKVGQTLTVVGIPDCDAKRFIIEFGHDIQNYIHINPRFDYLGNKNVTVFNSFKDGKYAEEIREGCFPFRHGEEFKVTVKFLPTGFLVSFCSKSAINVPNRLGAEEYSFFRFREDARIISVEVK
uniref:Galectin n=1 Tax=Kryptolebias marmoratus TaxID=37003 RepID=A0A3Q3EFP5_KRYMA